MCAALALFPLAVAVEFARRRAATRRRIAQEWAAVDRIAGEKGLSDADHALLRSLLKRWAPRDPLGPVSSRLPFDRCVEDHIAALEASAADPAEVERIGQQLRDIRRHLGLDFVGIGKRIQSTRELQVGQLMWVAPRRPGMPAWSRGRVVHVDEVHFAVRRKPHTSEGPPPRFNPGDRVRCRVWREDDARYAFDTEFVRYEDHSETWTLRHTSTLQRIQSREDFRVRQNIELPMDILLPSPDRDDADLFVMRASSTVMGRLVNISAGGCGVILERTLPKQALLRMRLPIGTESPVLFVARLVATTPLDGKRGLFRCAFVGLDQDARDTLARHVRQCQQQQLNPEEAPE